MKSICVAGVACPELRAVHAILLQGGMKAPLPAQHDPGIDIGTWHEHILANRWLDTGGQRAVQPGKLWEHLAVDIFLANIKAPVWGWSDARSTWLLDYWTGFESQLNFVLVCVSPQQMLANAIINPAAPEAAEALMAEWHGHHQEMLRFHHRHPDRSILVDAAGCLGAPDGLIKTCMERWQLPLDAGLVAAGSSLNHDPMALYLAQGVCENFVESTALQREIESSILSFAPAQPEEPPLAVETIFSGYRSLHGRLAEIARLAGTLAEVEKELGQERLGKKIKERENELLLLQLQKVQEELEYNFSLNQELRQTAGKNDRKAAAEAEALNGKLKEEKAADKKKLVELESQARRQKEELESQARKQEEELESQVRKQEEERNENQKKRMELESALLQMKEELESQARKQEEERNENQKKRMELESALLQMTEENISHQQDRELLLLQLHQIEEELERYFILHRQSGKTIEQLEQRWQRFMQRHPGYWDYESIQVVSEKQKVGAPPAWTWRITNLSAAGRNLPLVEFKTVLNEGGAGFVFARKGEGAPLLSWPGAADKLAELAILPIGRRESALQRFAVMRDLSTSDWNLVQILAQLLIKALDTPQTITAPPTFAPAPLRASLAKALQVFQKFPAVLRFDQISLQREQVNADYEHLWIRMSHLAVGGKQWPTFEFRLSCAGVRPNRFGHYPKLEFPENSGHAPLETWYAESHDDFGDKFELRFALPKSMDMEVWNSVSDSDRLFISGLIAHLPAILAAVRATGVTIRRPWEEWFKLVQEVQAIHGALVAPPAPIASPEVAPPAPAIPPVSPTPPPRQEEKVNPEQEEAKSPPPDSRGASRVAASRGKAVAPAPLATEEDPVAPVPAVGEGGGTANQEKIVAKSPARRVSAPGLKNKVQ